MRRGTVVFLYLLENSCEHFINTMQTFSLWLCKPRFPACTGVINTSVAHPPRGQSELTCIYRQHMAPAEIIFPLNDWLVGTRTIDWHRTPALLSESRLFLL